MCSVIPSFIQSVGICCSGREGSEEEDSVSFPEGDSMSCLCGLFSDIIPSS